MILERRPRRLARLTLEPIERRHAPGIHAVAVDSSAHLLPWMPWAVAHEVDSEEDFTARSEAAWAAGTSYDHAIVVEGRPSGVATLLVGHGGVGELGYWIAADVAGRGLVTEAATAVMAIGFEELALYRMELRAGVENHRSRRVAEKLGFTREGLLRNGLDGSEGVFDTYIFGITPSEWRARATASAVP